MACGDERLLGGAGMHEDRIDIARLAQLDRLAGSDDQQLHLDAGICRNLGQQHLGKAGIVKAGRDGQLHLFGMGGGAG